LDAVESALKKPDETPFCALFGQERSGGITGTNYMTGLLWALETLAWHPDYLTRVTMILGQLAEIDPGGNWANRPSNSLSTIFLPWFPQTSAPMPKRRAAIEALLREHKNVGWNLLLTLLPSSHQITTGSRKPAWREFIPADYQDGVSVKEYWEQVTSYSELAIREAKTDVGKLAELIGHLNDLPLPAHNKVLDHLSSDTVLRMPEEERLALWEALVNLASKHRKFSDANWAMKVEMVDKIEEVAAKLQPVSPALRCRRLFTERDFDLMEDKGDYEKERRELDQRRKKAVAQVLEVSGAAGILDFARAVDSPWRVGFALGTIAKPSFDSVLLPTHLEAQEKAIELLVGGFVRGRFLSMGWVWVHRVDTGEWTTVQKTVLLALLPFERKTWEHAERLLGADQAAYWERASANPYEAKEHLMEAVERLLNYGRARAAIQCLDRLIHKKAPITPDLAVRALEANPTSHEPVNSFDPHATLSVVQWLQDNQQIDANTLSRIEWNYLGLLDRHAGAAPRTLEKRLSESHDFFCELIRTVYRSETEEQREEKVTELQKRIVENADKLLHDWKTPPGTKADRPFDGVALNAWLEAVKESCAQSGHFKAAMINIGHVFVYAPQDPDGLWIHEAAASALNAKDAESMRNGFTSELFNRRGVHSWTAGAKELEIAADYRNKAEAVEGRGYHRLATSLRELALSYEHDAKREATRDAFDH
jgi:hypothetical protein